MATQWRAVVTLGPKKRWVQNGFATKDAAEKAARVEAGKRKNKKIVTGFRAEEE